MTRTLNQPIETKVQVLDSSGDPANSATVSYKIYDEADSLFDSGTMTFVADGIYSVAWTPDAAGEWTVETSSANPKFNKSFTYNVEGAMRLQYPSMEFTDISDENYVTVFEDSGELEILTVSTQQENGESATKDIQMRVTIDGRVWETVSNNNCAASNKYYWYTMDAGGIWAFTGVSGKPTFFIMSSSTAIEQFGYPAYPDFIVSSIPLKCHSFKVEIAVLSPGTNENVMTTVAYMKKEAVLGA